MEGGRMNDSEMARPALSRKRLQFDGLNENQGHEADEWHKYFYAQDGKRKIPKPRNPMTEMEPSGSHDKEAYEGAVSQSSDNNSLTGCYYGVIQSFSDDEMNPVTEQAFNDYFANDDRKRKRPQRRDLD